MYYMHPLINQRSNARVGVSLHHTQPHTSATGGYWLIDTKQEPLRTIAMLNAIHGLLFAHNVPKLYKTQPTGEVFCVV